jgi:hypothetical protein
MKRRYAKPTLQSLLRAYGLSIDELPIDPPYLNADRTGLELPERLREKTIRQIAAAAIWNDSGGFSVGDIHEWVKRHESSGSPLKFEQLREMWYEAGYKRQTLYNYCTASRNFPLGHRIAGLSMWCHYAVLVLNPTLREQVLSRAKREGWSLSQVSAERRRLRGAPEDAGVAAAVRFEGAVADVRRARSFSADQAASLRSGAIEVLKLVKRHPPKHRS